MPPKIPAKSLEKEEDFLPYELNYIPDEFRRRAKAELFEDEETRNNSLRLFKCMLNDEPDLRWQDDELFLLSFLRARKFDVKRAFHLIKTFYSVMRKRSELYADFHFEDVTRAFQENSVGFLPHRDSEGCVVLIVKLSNWKYNINTSGDVVRALTCGLLHANLSPVTHIAGFKVIFDVAGITLNHLPHISISHVWLLAEAIYNCFPGRFRGIHIVNENSIFYYFWYIVKKILSKKLRDRFHFHGKNVKKLCKYFSPSILPAEYGGEQGPFDNSEWSKLVQEQSEYITSVFSYGFQKEKSSSNGKNSRSSSRERKLSRERKVSQDKSSKSSCSSSS